MPRILLLEARHENPEHHPGVEYYPFLLALCRALGLEAAWWVVSVPRKDVPLGGTYHLDAEPFDVIRADIGAWHPDCIVVNDRPSLSLQQSWRAAEPGACIVQMPGHVLYEAAVDDVLALIGLGRSGDDRLLLDFEPCFARKFFDPAAESAAIQFHPLAVRFDCFWLRRAASNPYYERLDSEVVRNARGCAFCCLASGVAFHDVRAEGLERELCRVLAQIQAHQAACGSAVRRFSYGIDQSLTGENLDILIDRLLGLALRPTELRAMLRPDAILGKQKRLRELLPRMAAQGHSLRLMSIGVENLSDTENERLNKGVCSSQVFECDALLREWEDRYPDTFSVGPFSWILFTPWTRPEDLRINLEGLARLQRGQLRYILGTQLLLWEGTPAAELARRDGLLASEFGSTGDLALCCIEAANVRQLPWRFQDPRVARIHALLMRLEPIPEAARIAEDDGLLAEIRAARPLLPNDLAADQAALVLGVVEAVEALGEHAGVAQLFQHAARRYRPSRPRLASVEVREETVTLWFALPERRGVLVEPRNDARPGYIRTEHLQFSFEGAELSPKLKTILASLVQRWRTSTFPQVLAACRRTDSDHPL